MANKDAKFVLSELKAAEVSLVPKAANKRKFLLMKMDDEGADMSELEKADRPTKSDGGKNYYASDYAYVPDASKPSTWKLRLTNSPGGEPDSGIVGAAIAALGKGFRGNKVQIPSGDMGKVKAKVRAAWKKANPGKSTDEMPDVIKKDEAGEIDSAFEEEILKAELEEILEREVEDEGQLMEFIEKQKLSPRGLLAVKSAFRVLRGFEGELPGGFMDHLRGLLGNMGDPVHRTKKEDQEMADEVTKAAEETPVDDTDAAATEVEKAKKAAMPADNPQEEGAEAAADAKNKKKKPPFMAKDVSKADLDLDSLPEDVRERVQSIFKSHEDLEAQAEEIRKEAEEIRKEQEATKKELAAERDARATEQAIQKAATDYPNLPVKSDELGPMVKLAKEHFSEEQVATFERILKAADSAIADSKKFEDARENTFVLKATEGSALARLKDAASKIVEKSESGMTEAQAFSKALEQNPQLYDEYLAEMGG